MKKIFGFVVLFAFVGSAALAAEKLTEDRKFSAREFSRVVVLYDDGVKEEYDLKGNQVLTVPAGSTIVELTEVKKIKRATVSEETEPARAKVSEEPAAPAATEPSGISQKTGKSYSSSWEALMASRKGKETPAAPAAAPAAPQVTPAGLTIGTAPASPTPVTVASGYVVGVDSKFVGRASSAPMGLKAEIKKYGFSVVDIDPADERLGWATAFCATQDPQARVYATSEGCLVVWHANSGLISGSKSCKLEKNAPVSIDFDAGGKGGHAEPGQAFRYTGRLTVRY